MARKGHERRQANQNSEINRRGLHMLSLRYHVGPKILEVNIKNPQIIHVLVVLGQNAKVVGSIKVSRGGIDFFPSEKGRRLVFATSNKSKGRKGRKRALIKSRRTGEESQLFLASCASATIGVQDIEGWDRPRGNTTRVPR